MGTGLVSPWRKETGEFMTRNGCLVYHYLR